MASAHLKPDFDFAIIIRLGDSLIMNTFLRKTKKIWRKTIISRSMETAAVATVEPIQKLVRTEVEVKHVVQPEVPLMSLPYELLIQIMESVPVLFRSMTLSSFRL